MQPTKKQHKNVDIFRHVDHDNAPTSVDLQTYNKIKRNSYKIIQDIQSKSMCLGMLSLEILLQLHSPDIEMPKSIK